MGRRTRYHLAASRVHKWLALILGAQFLIWFASGALMSVVPRMVPARTGVAAAIDTGATDDPSPSKKRA